jgi:hypothetical protein
LGEAEKRKRESIELLYIIRTRNRVNETRKRGRDNILSSYAIINIKRSGKEIGRRR